MSLHGSVVKLADTRPAVLFCVLTRRVDAQLRAHLIRDFFCHPARRRRLAAGNRDHARRPALLAMIECFKRPRKIARIHIRARNQRTRDCHHSALASLFENRHQAVRPPASSCQFGLEEFQSHPPR